MTTLHIKAGPFEFEAVMEEANAPKTCAKFKSLLPYKERIIHVRWSGEGCWIPLGDLDLGLGYENHTSFPAPGEFILYPGGISETEILLAYGGVQIREQGRTARRQPLPDNYQGSREPRRARQAHPPEGRAGNSLQTDITPCIDGDSVTCLSLTGHSSVWPATDVSVAARARSRYAMTDYVVPARYPPPPLTLDDDDTLTIPPVGSLIAVTVSTRSSGTSDRQAALPAS